MDDLPVTARTRLHRRPQRGSTDRALLDAILDQGLVVHLGFATERGPFVIPTTYVRLDRTLYIHGSPASRMLRAGASGIELCATVTLIDGLVLARSAFHHSMNYRSAVILGAARVVEDPGEKGRALDALIERLVPGRVGEARAPSAEELKGTLVLALPLEEASVKVRGGPPIDDEADLSWPAWTGVIPLAVQAGAPIPVAGTHGRPPERTLAGPLASSALAEAPYQLQHGDCALSDDRARIDFERVTGWLQGSYWAPRIPRAAVERAAQRSSLVMGAYAPDGAQVGFLRVVSDGTRFAFLMDVFVEESRRGRGLGRAMVRFALGHPEHRGVVRWLLGTKDAHGVYETEGFGPLTEPTRLMERTQPWPWPEV